MPLRVPIVAAALATVLVASGGARGETSTSSVPSARFCALPRTPVLPPLSTMPESLRCFYDEDGNGLDDDVEAALARCFVPELRFDAAEPARGPKEPHTLYSVRRVPGQLDRLRITFSMLYARDAGFSEGLLCAGATKHTGDSESVNVTVRLVRGYKGWLAHVEYVDAGWPQGAETLESSEFSAITPTRPLLFPSVGKHHLYHHRHDAPYHASPVRCLDHARGDGAVIVPGIASSVGAPPAVDHVPLFFDGPGNQHSNAPLTKDRSRWLNACLVGLHPHDPSAWRAATRSLRPNRFGLGPHDAFVGEEIEGERFGGGLGGTSATVTPIWKTLLVDRVQTGVPFRPWDVDGDGRVEISGVRPFAASRDDRCPFAADGAPIDEDGDGFLAECDPDDTIRHVYVAGGGSGFGGPSYTAADDLAPSLLASQWPLGHTRGGFLDSDLDMMIDGEDPSPNSPGLPSLEIAPVPPLPASTSSAICRPRSLLDDSSACLPGADAKLASAPTLFGSLLLGDEPIVLSSTTPSFEGTTLVRPTRKDVRTLSLSRESEASWIATSRGSGVLLHASPPSPLGPQPEIAPDVLWVERGGSSRWARLTAVLELEGTLVYDAVAQGTLDVLVGDSTELVADARGETAAIVDLAAGVVVGWDPILSSWVRSTAPLEAVRRRVGASLALLGPNLFVAGGAVDGVPRGDLHAVDVFGRQTLALSPQFPPRTNARLLPTSDGRALVLFGGRDASNQAHDDAWIAEISSPRAVSPARKLFPDTQTPAALSPSAPLAATRDGIWSADAHEAKLRTSLGWSTIDG